MYRTRRSFSFSRWQGWPLLAHGDSDVETFPRMATLADGAVSRGGADIRLTEVCSQYFTSLAA